MKKLLLSSILALSAGTVAIAADLPKAKSVQPLPQVSEWAVRPYVQGTVGTNIETEYTMFGAKGGLETKYLRADVGYDYFAKNNLYSANVFLQAPVYKFTPFVGVGLGRVYDVKAKFDDVSLLTLGTRINLTNNWSLEVAGRQINGIDNKKLHDNQLLTSVVYKF